MTSAIRLELPDLERLAEKRAEVRYPLNGFVPATVKGPEEQDLDVVMLDVSRGGLGLLANGYTPRVGDVLKLCIEGQEKVHLEVRWMRSSRLGNQLGLNGLTRVGLAVLAAQDNLLQRLEPFACIDL